MRVGLGFSPARLWAIVVKEFVQMRRDRMTFATMIFVPILQLTLFGYAINTDPKQLPTAVLVRDEGPLTRAVLAAMKNTGLKVESPRGDSHLAPTQATDDPAAVGPVDIVLFCVKLWDVESAGQHIRPLVGPKTADRRQQREGEHPDLGRAPRAGRRTDRGRNARRSGRGVPGSPERGRRRRCTARPAPREAPAAGAGRRGIPCRWPAIDPSRSPCQFAVSGRASLPGL